MCKKIRLLAAGLAVLVLLGGCGKTDPDVIRFRNEVENFCNSISELDTSINGIDASSGNAPAQLLEYLDEVDLRFRSFSELDFPSSYAYLEPLAEDASRYMTEAVAYYHQAYSQDSYSESSAKYALENYTRAFKRIKIIIAFLRGENSNDPEVSVSYEEEG